jgi:hypothetical protein
LHLRLHVRHARLQVAGKGSEMDAVLALKPQRLGHALYLTPAQVRASGRWGYFLAGVPLLSLLSLSHTHRRSYGAIQVAVVQALRVPVELCPTSNLKTLGLRNLADHPTAKTWLESGHPFSVNTDDSGVFATSSSEEHALLFESLRAPLPVAAAVSCAAANHAFCGGAMRSWLQKSMRNECKALCALDRVSFGLY